jgi:hypothetical protein
MDSKGNRRFVDSSSLWAGTAASVTVEMDCGMNEGLLQYEKPLVPAQRARMTLEGFARQVFAPASRG